MIDDNFNVIMFSLVFGLLLLAIGLMFIPKFVTGAKESYVSNGCFNSSLEDTASCLKAFVNGFYHYNITNKEKNLSLDELKQLGGVCWHYAELYYNMLKERGFNAEAKVIYTHDEAHEFTLAWNDDLSEYCLLDQLNVNCWGLR